MGVPDDQATPLQNGFGLFFTVFCCWYFFRVVKKRAARAKNIRLSKFQSRVQRESRDDEELVRARDLSARQAFFGGITGLSISFLLFGFAKTIQANFDGRAVPDSYQVRQITITVRTIVEGLAYLATFIYAANGIGLISLGLQKCLGNKVSTGEDTDSRLPESENVVEEK